MASAYKCDACGKFYIKSGLIIPAYDEHKIFNHIEVLTKHGPESIKFDLCDECLEKILNMLHVKTVNLVEKQRGDIDD